MSFPCVYQYDSSDNALSALSIITSFYKNPLSVLFIKEWFHLTYADLSIEDLCDLSTSLGVDAQQSVISLIKLQESFTKPCIIHWEQKHFVVLYKIKKTKHNTFFFISDPEVGLVKYTERDFIKHWKVPNLSPDIINGVVIDLNPQSKFYRIKESPDRQKTKKPILNYLNPYKRYFIQIFIGLLTASLLTFIFPFLTQAIIDKGIEAKNINIIIIILVAQITISIGQIANVFLINWLLAHISFRIGITLISDFLRKIIRLPIVFFDSKGLGDIIQRVDDHNRIQEFLTGTLIGIVSAVISLIVYSVIMVKFNWLILIIFLIGSSMYVGWILVFLKQRRYVDNMRFKEQVANQNNLIQLISGIHEIKLNDCEDEFHNKWELIQHKLYKLGLRSLKITQLQEFGGALISQLSNLLISFVAAYSVINGEMTLGMLMALLWIIGQLNAPISQLVSFVSKTQDANLSLSRITDIHSIKEDNRKGLINVDLITSPSITLENVSFKYNGLQSEDVLKNINLHIPSNKVTAIVGSSGSGKTTLLKLVLGLYETTSGNINIDNLNLKKYDNQWWRKQCSVVLQNGFIFSDTVLNNICLKAGSVDDSKLQRAIKISNLKEVLSKLPLGLYTKIGHEGHGLSSGQIQRILIARAVYKDGAALILDEATNALDVKNEKSITNNLELFSRRKTVIIVAHRLSTVIAADHIVVMEKGEIIEKGNHESLVEKKGAYYKLIKEQLELNK